MYSKFIAKCEGIIDLSSKYNTLLIGDFNLPDLIWSNSQGPDNVLGDKPALVNDLIHSCSLQQLNFNRNQNYRILHLVLNSNYNGSYFLAPAPPITRMDIHHPPFEIVFRKRSNLLVPTGLV